MTPAAVARARERGLLASELADAWPVLSAEERLEGLRLLPHAEAEDLLLSLPARDQAELILETSPGERRSWMRLLPPDDAADVVQAAPDKTVRDIMHTDVVTAHESMDQEALSRLFAEHDFLAIPVLDDERHVKGIVTVDDIVDVVQEEATEDIQKFGGMEALDAPYLDIGFWTMVRKRGGWLSALFLSEMLTATAMGRFQDEIARAVILALFVPLIISSGGNSGSQASTLVVRALALGELRLRDWWRVIRREVAAGLALGGILAGLGFSRILLWQTIFRGMYGQHYLLIAFTVAA